MITLLIVLASIGVYLAVGVAYARVRAVAVYRRNRRANMRLTRDAELLDKWARREVPGALAVRMLMWPLFAVLLDWFLLAGNSAEFSGLLTGPIAAQRQAAAAKRAEADGYEELIRACDDPTERDLMRAGQQALRQQAKEMDL